MMKASDSMNLTGKLLIAMPGMGDPRFDRSVIFICAHSAEGTMGLIINKPVADLSFAEMLEQLGIAKGPGSKTVRVHFGGPVENGRGFVLHSGEYHGTAKGEGTLAVSPSFGMTATLDILEDISAGRGPIQALLALGYAGWGPNQLETEILSNGWLTCDATPELVFASDNGGKWERALKTLGVDALTLSATAGRA